MRKLVSCLLISGFATAAFAEDQPNTILVLDGSGSMWGQIDGVSKIEIARDVVTGLLGTLPDEQRLGLTVYGHRERGNCSDIETMVAPAPGNGAAIAQAVSGISPLGKTPMTDAVIAAAEALRYSEDSATVILISYGVETCNPDPCAAAELLEETGVDFTAHVIGFDISDPEALLQMQCIADATGGKFLTAADAGELSDALTTVASEPVTLTASFQARLGTADGALIRDPVVWSVSGFDGTSQANPLTLDVAAGSYDVSAVRSTDGAAVDVTATFAAGSDQTVTVIFPEIIPQVTLSGPASAPLGSMMQVNWTGPGGARDTIGIGKPGNRPLNTANTRDGTRLDLLAPTEPGSYELGYFAAGSSAPLITVPIEILAVPVTIAAPAQAVIGQKLSLSWTGPDYDGDAIAIGIPGKSSDHRSYTSEGATLELQMPGAPGAYELRYTLGQRGAIIYSQPISVIAAPAQIEAPDTARVGERVLVGWSGPDYDQDRIVIGEIGKDKYINSSFTRDGNPLSLRMPAQPGTYEIRYRLHQDREDIATRLIEVLAADVALDAPEQAVAGSKISVEWRGPDHPSDRVVIGEVGERRHINSTYTSKGSPLELTMPSTPGSYEIRYRMHQDSEVLATRPIEVIAVEASLDAPEQAVAGSKISIEWTGPDYGSDRIVVAEIGARRHINSSYTSRGNPLTLRMPDQPGTYEIRYRIHQDRQIIATRLIEVTPADGSSSK